MAKFVSPQAGSPQRFDRSSAVATEKVSGQAATITRHSQEPQNTPSSDASQVGLTDLPVEGAIAPGRPRGQACRTKTLDLIVRPCRAFLTLHLAKTATSEPPAVLKSSRPRHCSSRCLPRESRCRSECSAFNEKPRHWRRRSAYAAVSEAPRNFSHCNQQGAKGLIAGQLEMRSFLQDQDIERVTEKGGLAEKS